MDWWGGGGSDREWGGVCIVFLIRELWCGVVWDAGWTVGRDGGGRGSGGLVGSHFDLCAAVS